MGKMKAKNFLKGGKKVAEHFNRTYRNLEQPVLNTPYACQLFQNGSVPSEPENGPFRFDVKSSHPADPNVTIEGVEEIAEGAEVTVSR